MKSGVLEQQSTIFPISVVTSTSFSSEVNRFWQAEQRQCPETATKERLLSSNQFNLDFPYQTEI
jgi:hypothetical protein